MKAKQASRTALVAVVHRALESEKPEQIRICCDRFARRFIGPTMTALGEVPVPQDEALAKQKQLAPGFHDYLAARTRHIDECVDACVRDGIRQLVILGAGYDSRAYRIDSLRRKVTIFELDHPDTQRRKLEKLVEILGTLPPNVRYVPIDFNVQALGEELDRNGYDRSAKTLFIWEGVTYYLDGPTIDGTLAFVRDCSEKGSSIIFDCTYVDVINGMCDRTEAKRWLEQVRLVGEPLSFGFERGTVEKFLEQRGFTRAHNADGAWIDNAYFAGLSEKRSMTPIFAIVHATT